MLVIAKNLSKTYDDVLALNDVSCQVDAGEIVGLLGPNGAGKTTLMHILVGLLTPTSGEVSILGMNPMTERHRIAEKIHFSSAYIQLPPNLKVLENLQIFAGLYNVKNSKEKIVDLLHEFGIAHLKDRMAGALSSGERTRLNLCKCLLNDPELLLLDEPTASLDPEMADGMRTLIKKIQREKNIGVIYTSHNMKEIEALCDRILFIHHGKIIAQGSQGEMLKLFSSKNLDEVFIKIVRGE